jgi:16S rRNA (cytidine1402-2'-O)-methyltransferase
MLEAFRAVPGTLIVYETPSRIEATLLAIGAIFPDRQITLARELTKIHEEIVRDSLGELAKHYQSTTVKGEMVIVIDRKGIEPAIRSELGLTGRIAELEKQGIDPKAALKKAAKEFGLSKSDAYRQVRIKSKSKK